MIITSTKFNKFDKFQSSSMKLIKLYKNAHCYFENFVTCHFDTFALLLTILLTLLLSRKRTINKVLI